MPGTSGISRSQSVHQYTIQNSQNERNDMRKMVEELEAKLSHHSLNLLTESKGDHDEVLATKKE